MRIGLFPGSFNPPTIAHLALLDAAQRQMDRVAAVLPREFPHKSYDHITIEDRIAMLEAARAATPFEVKVTGGGLFIDIARELAPQYGPNADLWFICGRDAAERIVEWDYGQPCAIDTMLDEFGLLVAARQGEYSPPARLAHRIRTLDVPPDYSSISATEVRTRMQRGQPWDHLVPPGAADLVSRVYGQPRARNK